MRTSDRRLWTASRAVVAAGALHGLPAQAMDFSNPSPSYTTSVNVGLFVGFAFEPRLTFAYGMDVRLLDRPTVFLRAEGRGTDHFIFTAGALMGAQYSVGELGWSVVTGSRELGTGLASGVHAGAGLGNLGTHLLLQGVWPLIGDRGNYDLSLTGMVVVPEFFSFPNGIGSPPIRLGLRVRQGGGYLLPPVLRQRLAPDNERGSGREQEALASRWRENARNEAGSAPAFERMAAELWAVGAPRSLVMRAQQAAPEELRHGAFFADQAGALSAERVQPLPMALAPRWSAASSEALATLAREAWEEGCLGEASAAAVLRRMGDATRDPHAAAMLHSMAQDEARHAELAWAVVDWLWHSSDAARDALVEAAEQRWTPDAVAADDSLDHDWLRARGLLPAVEESDIALDQRKQALRRFRQLS